MLESRQISQKVSIVVILSTEFSIELTFENFCFQAQKWEALESWTLDRLISEFDVRLFLHIYRSLLLTYTSLLHIQRSSDGPLIFVFWNVILVSFAYV